MKISLTHADIVTAVENHVANLLHTTDATTIDIVVVSEDGAPLELEAVLNNVTLNTTPAIPTQTAPKKRRSSAEVAAERAAKSAASQAAEHTSDEKPGILRKIGGAIAEHPLIAAGTVAGAGEGRRPRRMAGSRTPAQLIGKRIFKEPVGMEGKAPQSGTVSGPAASKREVRRMIRERIGGLDAASTKAGHLDDIGNEKRHHQEHHAHRGLHPGTDVSQHSAQQTGDQPDQAHHQQDSQGEEA